MILAVDIGNTDLTFGVIDRFEVKARWALHSDLNRSEDEYADLVQAMVGHAGAGPIADAVIGSVVPALPERLEAAVGTLVPSAPLVVRAEEVPDIVLQVDNPAEVGVDRVANAIGARSSFGTPVIVADIGSVTTFDVVDGDGNLRGVVIAPGVRALGEALTASGAQLPKVDIGRPDELVGRNTEDAMRSGVYWGYIDLVRGVIHRLQSEPGQPWTVVATGGLAAGLAEDVELFDEVDPDITLRGLARIHHSMTAR